MDEYNESEIMIISMSEYNQGNLWNNTKVFQELGENSTLLSRLGDKAVLLILEQRAILGEERQELRGDILVEIISRCFFLHFKFFLSTEK